MRFLYEVMEKENSKKTEKENEGNIQRRKNTSFVEEKNNGEGKGGIFILKCSICNMYCCC